MTTPDAKPSPAPLTESDYDAVAVPALHQLIESLDALSQASVEAELASDILTIEFDDGTRYVLNSHRAARQIWLSAERSPGTSITCRARRAGSRPRAAMKCGAR